MNKYLPVILIASVACFCSSCGESEKHNIKQPEKESSSTTDIKPFALFDAIDSKDINTLNKILAAGTDLEERDKDGYTPLLSSVMNGATEIVEILIIAGADVNAKYMEPEDEKLKKPSLGICNGMSYEDGETSLHWAANADKAELAEMLLRNGAKLDIKDANGHVPLVDAVLSHNVEIVKILVNHGASLDYRDDKGRTLLHMISDTFSVDKNIVADDGELVKYLIANGISPNATDKSGRTPLHYAAEAGAGIFAELLIENGASVNITDSEGYTPLDLALMNDNPHCILLLHSHNGIFSREKPSSIPEAAVLEDIEILKSMISSGKQIDEEDSYGNTGLHYAAEDGLVDIAKLLISGGANPDKKNNMGNTPLYEAVSNNHLPVCRLLVEHGADVNIRVDGDFERTPLHKAVRNDNLEICKLLIENAADPNRKDEAIRDFPGRTPLDWAISEGHKEIEQFLRTRGAKTARELLEKEK